MNTRYTSGTERDRGLGRLRSLTAAVSVASVAAAAGFGLVSALSNPGSQAAAVEQAATQVSSDAGAGGTSTGTSTSTTTAASSATPTLQPAVQAPIGVSGGGQTTTGGS